MSKRIKLPFIGTLRVRMLPREDDEKRASGMNGKCESSHRLSSELRDLHKAGTWPFTTVRAVSVFVFKEYHVLEPCRWKEFNSGLHFIIRECLVYVCVANELVSVPSAEVIIMDTLYSKFFTIDAFVIGMRMNTCIKYDLGQH